MTKLLSKVVIGAEMANSLRPRGECQSCYPHESLKDLAFVLFFFLKIHDFSGLRVEIPSILCQGGTKHLSLNWRLCQWDMVNTRNSTSPVTRGAKHSDVKGEGVYLILPYSLEHGEIGCHINPISGRGNQEPGCYPECIIIGAWLDQK